MMNDDDGRVQIVVMWLRREGGGHIHFGYGSDGTNGEMRTNSFLLFLFFCVVG
jgi:hypothetical protein